MLADHLVSLLDALPDWLVVLIISMMPFIELRGAIPVALGYYDMPLLAAFVLCVVGNMIPVPFILLIFEKVEKFLRRWKFWNRFFDRLFDRTVRRASEKVEKYQELGIITFVAIPLPGTGAWTGALIAYLFGLDMWKSFWVITLGVLIAGILVTMLTVGAIGIF